MTTTPGPWDYVPSTEHHGPYVTSQFGSTICDFYVMSHPAEPSTANGGRSRPISFMAEMADDNARLVSAAHDLRDAVEQALDDMGENGHCVCEAAKQQMRAAIAKATGGQP